MKLNPIKSLSIVILLSVFVGGCATNPVTGKNELMLVSEDWELAVGKQYYSPLRQQQGGDYTADPAVEAYVRKVGQRLAAQSDRDLPYEFNVINDSSPNAWALPGGKISINRGLLVRLKDEAELAAVLGHEIVHSAARHGAKGQSRGVLLQGAVAAATIVGNSKGYGQAAQLGSSIAAQLTNQRYGRAAELESDLYGMRYMAKAGYDVQGAVGLQETFVRLSKGRRNDFITNLFASHPPSRERVVKNKQTAAVLGAGGEKGGIRYAKAMARIKKMTPAYEIFDEARVAHKEKNLKKAVDLTKRAINIEPKEGHFHSFLGDISMQVNNMKAAKTYFTQAIKLNPNFYYYQVRRGEVNQKLGAKSAARADYQSSLKLMPTAEAQYGLGIIERDAGNIKAAKEMLSGASQSSGDIGKKATSALLELDLGDNPGNYLIVNRGLTSKGTFAFQLINKTSSPLTGIKLGVTMNGNKTTSNISGSIGAGETRIIDTGRSMSKAQSDAVQVILLSAVVDK